MKTFFLIISLLFCNCFYTGWYIVEVERESQDKCKEIVREKQIKNSQFKKVYYKIKEECRENFKKRRRENLWN